MAKKLFDTSTLLHHWNRSGGNAPADKNVDDAKSWARELIDLHTGIDAILTPVYLEVVVGALSAQQLQLARAFLQAFRIVDEGKILAEDWVEARRIAERVPRKPYRRQLGDCLIRAIANRLRYEVIAIDTRFP